MNDLKFAFCQLLNNPGFAAVATLTLAPGIEVQLTWKLPVEISVASNPKPQP